MKVQEILDNYQQKFNVKDVVSAKKWLVAPATKAALSNGVFASFKDGRLHSEVLSGGCHSALSTAAPSTHLIACSTKQPRPVNQRMYTTLLDSDKPLAIRWLDYVLNGNFFSPFYVHTSLEDATVAGFLVPATLPANLILGCCILTRHQHEKTSIIAVWDKLVASGVDRDVAYIMCFGLGLDSAHLNGNYPVAFSPAGHNALTFATPKMIKGLLNREYNNLLGAYSAQKGGQYFGYGQSSSIPFPQGKRDNYGSELPFRNALIDFFATMSSPSLSKIKEIASPFAKKTTFLSSLHTSKTPKGNSYPLLETILKYSKEFESFLTTEYLNVK